jgi:hypothetical protein
MSNPFDPEPDQQLGALLRAHLDAPDHVAFVARVRSALAGVEPGTSWDVLAGWIRPGLAAAAMLALTVALWMGLGGPFDAEPVTLADAAQAAGVPAPLLAAEGASTDAVLAAIVGDR